MSTFVDTLSEQEDRSATEHPLHVQTLEQASAQTDDGSDEEEPPLVPLPINGSWQTMTFIECVRACSDFGQYVPSIYFYKALEIAWMDPTVYDKANLPELEEEDQQTLDLVLLEVQAAETVTMQPPASVMTTTEEAYGLILQAEEQMDAQHFMEAAELSDRAMRTPSREPLGVRLRALRVMSYAAMKAGYLAEAVETLRELVNLAALLGLKIEQTMASMGLARALIKVGKYAEAAEVAQNALDILERYPNVSAPAVSLNYYSADAHTRLQHGASAAEHHFAAAMILQRTNERIESTIAAFEQAGEDFRDAHEYARAIDAHQRAVDLARQAFQQAQAVWTSLSSMAESQDDAEKEEAKSAEQAFALALRQFVNTLYQCSRTIVWQPGNVPDSDVAAMEALMEELREIVVLPDYDPYLRRTSAWREADWLSDMGQMMANAYRHTLAIDYYSAALGRFDALGDVENRALQHAFIARVYMGYGDLGNARESLTDALALLEPPQYAGSTAKNIVRQLMRDLKEAESEHRE